MNPTKNSSRTRPARGGRARVRGGGPGSRQAADTLIGDTPAAPTPSTTPATLGSAGDGADERRGLLLHTPLKSPLHVKRQRLWQPSDAQPPSTSTEPTISWDSLGDTPAATTSSPTAMTPPSPIAPSPLLYSLVPSPASFATYRRSLQVNESNMALNYGSDPEEVAHDSDCDYDDDADSGGGVAGNAGADAEGSSLYLPRTQRTILGTVAPPAETMEAESSERVPSTSAIEHEPRSLFNFVWRNFPDPPVLPAERREKFSDINCGPTAPFLTPYEAFTAIWDRDFMEYIAVETNRYAQQLVEKQLQDGSLGPNSRIANWRDTDANELYVYLGLLLATGMVVKGDLKEYWSNDEILSTPCFGRCMNVNRYLLLSRCLHFNNNTTDIMTLTQPKAKISKIAPVIAHLNQKFQSLYRLGRNIALDESLTQWKGCVGIKQFIRNKVASVGIKTYEVCEAQTGYLWRFKVHAGREEATGNEVTPVSGIPTLVLELLKGLENKGHTVWMDNYYNSPALARVLKSLGFDCVGTLRTERQCVPTQLANLKKLDMAVGQISGSTSGDVDVLVWRDQNRVAMISTYHGNSVHTVGGKMKPTAVHDYNVCMGGVDKKDQMLSGYPLERKRTHIWYKKFFRRLLNASVLNALILHRRTPIPDTGARISNHRKFRLELIRQLLSKHNVWRAPAVSTSRLVRPVFTSDITNHFLVELEMTKYGTSKPERQRRTCAFCHKRTYFKCPACDVALCLGCTKAFHESL